MDIYELFRLLSAAAGGAQTGSFLLLSLLYKNCLRDWPYQLEQLTLFKHFYRLNTVLAISAGILAVLGNANQAGLLFAVLGVSYILANMHLLRAISSVHQHEADRVQRHLKRNPREQLALLSRLQQAMHLTQVLANGYLLSLLV